MNYSDILFDLDGTLTNPKLGITKSVQYALRKFAIEESDLDKLEPFIGPPLAASFMETYSFSESDAKQAVEYYREYFKDQGMYENDLYEGISELLELLQSQNRRLIVATSKPTVFAEKILSYFKIDRYFEYVCGSHLDGTRTDKGEIIKHVLDEKKIDREETVMIGDRKYDIIGAHRNNLDSIAVVYGYGSEEELRGSNPTHYIKTVKELHSVFSAAR